MPLEILPAYGPIPARLVFLVVDRDFMMYRIHIMNVDPDTTLTTGMFANFRDYEPRNPVPYDYMEDEWPNRNDRGPFQINMGRMIEWCVSHVTEEIEWWCFSIAVHSVSRVTTTFYFSNDDTALEFKLACL